MMDMKYSILTIGIGVLPPGTKVGEIETDGDPAEALLTSRQCHPHQLRHFRFAPLQPEPREGER